MPLSPGQILNNRYSILKLLGQGGFGAVYRAWDLNMDRTVAVKENLDTTPQAQRQFYREAQILFDLSHPNLPRVMDHFVIQGQGQYLMMEFIEGQDLQEMLQQVGGPLPEDQVILWIGQVCDALIYLHSQNPPIIHRDIKPANIKITPQGKAFLVDFGIAKIFDLHLTKSGTVKAVTPGYSPLEQYGQGTTDAQSDVYALGATLYHLLAGIQPPASVDIIGKVFPPPRSPNSINSAISPRVSSAIEKAMQLEKKDRWSSILELKSTFTPPVLHQPPLPASSVGPHGTVVVSAQQESPPFQSTAPVVQRALPWRWLGVVSVLGILVVILVAVVVGLLQGDRKETPTVPPDTQLVGLMPSDTLLSLLPTTQAPLVTYLFSPSITEVSTTSTFTEGPSTSTTEIPTTLTTLPVDFTDEQGVKMKLIPAGEFQMGSESGYGNEKPVHTIYLDAFYMDIYEVTNALYARCVEAGACTEPSSQESYTRDPYYGNSTYNDYPVIWVSWEQANDFCEWRGTSLPTEGEWEKAARGGLEGKLYPWGDQEPDCSMANYKGKDGYCEGDTARVGNYTPNGFGLFDMAGNVWEWVIDWYSENYYTSSPSKNPTGPNSGEERVLRGGSWDIFDLDLWVAYRGRSDPTVALDVRGFRCSRGFSAPLPTSTKAPPLSTTEALLPPTTEATLQADFTDEQSVHMNLIPAGKFQMGSESGSSDESPVHTVYLDAFYMDIYEVTNSLYSRCVQAGVCTEPLKQSSYTYGSYYGNPEYSNYPVVYVSWEQARGFCKWRWARLPTEAEWEKAARGGLEDKLYPWGDQEPDCSRANYWPYYWDEGGGCKRDTTKVGSFSANGYGLFDMAGNVWEWVWDSYSDFYYDRSPSLNPHGPEPNYFRVLRGGSWESYAWNVRVADRFCYHPDDQFYIVGFRCARSADTIPTPTPSP